MELGLQTVGDTFDYYAAAARWAEERGMAVFAIPDHYLAGGGPEDLGRPANDAMTIMAGLAMATEKIDLAVLVSPIAFRHPAVLAKSAATIQEMADGRFRLGVGTGWLEEEHSRFGIPFPDRSTRFTMME